jgi:glycosyltransferase involved in cell wall biosynthesis
MKKIKVFVLADNPLAPSGVATQTRYMIEGLLKTGRYSFVCFGGAIKHQDYNPIRVDGYGDDWIIFPVDGYGNQEQVRSMLQNHKPDIMWIMTDPRFWPWLWDIENEVRSVVPLVYYHVWDNYPYPNFNKQYYMSNDMVATISKVTDDIVANVAPGVKRTRIPHTTNTSIFKRVGTDEINNFRKNNNLAFKKNGEEKFIFFWNNRNARRKQSGTLIWWFNDFLEKVGKENACLIMHTEPKDENGQDLEAIMENLNLVDGEILLSTRKMPAEELAFLYNVADCTINISDAEGFGLGTLESLACETPIIVNMTGGLQEQVVDENENWFGVGIEPSSKAIIGSQQVPYIYEDRISKEDFIAALLKIYNMSEEERNKLGAMGRDHVLQNYGHDSYVELWDKTLTNLHEEVGSWSNRKHKSWELIDLNEV